MKNYADRIDMDTMIDKRYEQIRNFEKYLWENSIRVVKIFLNVSKDEQAKRFISRIDTPKKNWKFSSGDIDERAYWDVSFHNKKRYPLSLGNGYFLEAEGR